MFDIGLSAPVLEMENDPEQDCLRLVRGLSRIYKDLKFLISKENTVLVVGDRDKIEALILELPETWQELENEN